MRVYETAAPSVRAFYRENHSRQTLAFVREKRAEYLPLRRQRMGVFEAAGRRKLACPTTRLEFVLCRPQVQQGQGQQGFQAQGEIRQWVREGQGIIAGSAEYGGRVVIVR